MDGRVCMSSLKAHENKRLFFFLFPASLASHQWFAVVGHNQSCVRLSSNRKSTKSSGREKVLLCPTFPMLTAETLARNGSRYWPNYVCLCQIVYTWLNMCVCGIVSGFLNCTGDCVGVYRLFGLVCVCGHLWLRSLTLPLHSQLQSLSLLSLSPPSPSLYPGAFPEHTTNKVGQVHSWTLFLSESNFQEVPTGKWVPACQTMEPWQGISPPPLTSAEPLCDILVGKEHGTARAERCINRPFYVGIDKVNISDWLMFGLEHLCRYFFLICASFNLMQLLGN